MKANALNVYTCDTCGKQLLTRDRDEGTTPFMLKCKETKACPGTMKSACYRVAPEWATVEPGLEWIKPSQAELMAYLKTKPRRFHRGIRDHVARGGLVDVRIPRH